MTEEARSLVEEPTIQYRVTGMDCADDAREIEEAAGEVAGVVSAKVSTASHVLTLQHQAAAFRTPELEEAISRIGYRLDLIHSNSTTPRHVTPQYRRALWIVVVLNVGFGVAEMIGGFISESQALKADALDFLGDSLITMFGVLAIGWSLVWRARSALIQGVFLGVLGLSILGNTAYRIVFQQQPEAELMGAIAVAALLVNVAAAVILIPHRTGDANARAIWLFSRNDAIGNAAVIVAAFLVAWTRTPWPDLAVAAIVASLFLHSACSIVADARNDLHSDSGESRLVNMGC